MLNKNTKSKKLVCGINSRKGKRIMIEKILCRFYLSRQILDTAFITVHIVHTYSHTDNLTSYNLCWN